jgi:hypothetical protein
MANKNCFYWGSGSAGGSDSFWSANTAQVFSNVGFVEVDGAFECSVASASRQIVRER